MIEKKLTVTILLPFLQVATDLAGDIEALVDGEGGQTVVAGERALNNGVSANRNSMGSNRYAICIFVFCFGFIFKYVQ